ncbi:lasso RiPP family leader peptide-containing protein [Streptomyces sp. NPDC127068]
MKKENEGQGYEPPVVEEVGTVTEATLGANKKDGQDDTEYWH